MNELKPTLAKLVYELNSIEKINLEELSYLTLNDYCLESSSLDLMFYVNDYEVLYRKVFLRELTTKLLNEWMVLRPDKGGSLLQYKNNKGRLKAICKNDLKLLLKSSNYSVYDPDSDVILKSYEFYKRSRKRDHLNTRLFLNNCNQLSDIL